MNRPGHNPDPPNGDRPSPPAGPPSEPGVAEMLEILSTDADPEIIKRLDRIIELLENPPHRPKYPPGGGPY